MTKKYFDFNKNFWKQKTCFYRYFIKEWERTYTVYVRYTDKSTGHVKIGIILYFTVIPVESKRKAQNNQRGPRK